MTSPASGTKHVHELEHNPACIARMPCSCPTECPDCLAQIAAFEERVRVVESQFIETDAILEAVIAVLDGKPTSNFMQSFSVVRRVLDKIAAFEADLDDLALERDGIKHSRTCPNNVVTGNPSELPCLRCQRDELERQTSSIEQQLRERCAALERRIEGLEARLESYTDLIDSAYCCENCWMYIPKETK